MEQGALAPYENALRTKTPVGLIGTDGRMVGLDVERWLRGVDDIDREVLDRCVGPVLDVGCGPGRFVFSLNERGIPAMGVDIATTAIALTRGQGLPALLRNVFGELPGEGRWPTVLLMDGNIGIGGEPQRLIERIRSLLAPGGWLLVESHADPEMDERLDVRFTRAGVAVGPPFKWAHVGIRSLLGLAAAAGYVSGVPWSSGGRSFVALRRPLFTTEPA